MTSGTRVGLGSVGLISSLSNRTCARGSRQPCADRRRGGVGGAERPRLPTLFYQALISLGVLSALLAVLGAWPASASATVSSHDVAYVFDDSVFPCGGNGCGMNDLSGPGQGASLFVNAFGQAPGNGNTSTYTPANGTLGPVTLTNVPLSELNANPSALQGYDTAIIYEVCAIGDPNNTGALAEINNFLLAGGKVMIFTADGCAPNALGTADWSGFVFPFETNNPGPQGAAGDYTSVQPSTLTAGLSVGPQPDDSMGDANVFTTYDGNWTTSIVGDNLYTNGVVEAYATAPSGGLAIYEGEDFWYTDGPDPHLQVVFDDMLSQSWNPSGLPNGVAASGITLSPTAQTATVGNTGSLTVSVADPAGTPQPGVVVNLSVSSGPDAGAKQSGVTGSDGKFTFSLQNGGAAGTDTIIASYVDASGNTHASNTAMIQWQPGGSATTVSFSLPEADIPYGVGAGLGGVKLGDPDSLASKVVPLGRFPLALVLQPSVQLSGSFSSGFSLTPSPRASSSAYEFVDPANPSSAWTLGVSNLGWSGPGVRPARLSWDGLRSDLGLPTIVSSDNPSEEAIKLGLADTGATYTQAFPVASGEQATIVLDGKLYLSAESPLAPLAVYLAEQAVLRLGADALSGGTAEAVIDGVCVAQTAANIVQLADTIDSAIKTIWALRIDASTLTALVGQIGDRVAKQALSYVMAQIRHLLGAITSYVTSRVSALAKRISSGLSFLVKPALAFGVDAKAGTAPITTTPIGALSLRPVGLRQARRVRPAYLNRSTARRLAGGLALNAPGTPVLVRPLLTSSTTLRPRGRLTVLAGNLPGTTALILLEGPGGYAAQTIVKLNRHAGGATISLPPRLARGTWQVGIVDYNQAGGKHPRVILAAAQLTARK